MVSGSSGAMEPYTLQFSVSPSLIAATCSADSVRLNTTATELPSWAQNAVVSLSR